MTAATAERGTIAVEAVLLAPLLFLMIAVVYTTGQLQDTHGAVEETARDAARAASLATTPAAARTAGTRAGTTVLAQLRLGCRGGGTVRIDTSRMKVTATRPGLVTATVTCQIPLADLAGLRVPAALTLKASFPSVVDAYRAAR